MKNVVSRRFEIPRSALVLRKLEIAARSSPPRSGSAIATSDTGWNTAPKRASARHPPLGRAAPGHFSDHKVSHDTMRAADFGARWNKAWNGCRSITSTRLLVHWPRSITIPLGKRWARWATASAKASAARRRRELQHRDARGRYRLCLNPW